MEITIKFDTNAENGLEETTAGLSALLNAMAEISKSRKADQAKPEQAQQPKRRAKKEVAESDAQPRQAEAAVQPDPAEAEEKVTSPQQPADNGDLPFQPQDIAPQQPAVQPEPAEAGEKAAQPQQPAAQPAPQPAAVSAEDFRKAHRKKMAELQLGDGEPNFDKKPAFIDFVHKLSEAYGNRLPSKLSDEQRAKFILEYNSIEWSDAEGFHTTYAPF